jgi:hypothetical protein
VLALLYPSGSGPCLLLTLSWLDISYHIQDIKAMSAVILPCYGEVLWKSLHLLYDIKLIFSKSEIMLQGARTCGSDALCGVTLFRRVGIPYRGLFPHHPLLRILHFAWCSRCVLTHTLMHHGAVIKCSKVRLKNCYNAPLAEVGNIYHCTCLWLFTNMPSWSYAGRVLYSEAQSVVQNPICLSIYY